MVDAVGGGAGAATATRVATFLFTDIEGSTRLLETLGDTYPDVLDAHWQLLRDAFRNYEGEEFGAEGDAMFFAFPRPSMALEAAMAGQRALASHVWPTPTQVRVRMAIHTGDARRALGTWVGLAVHQTARTCAAGHGGQVLVSAETAARIDGALPPESSLRDLGEYRLRDISGNQRIYQLDHPTLDSTFPALRTPTAQTTNLPHQLTTFVGRQAELTQLGRMLTTHRMITLTGPGGVGKTRLALELSGAAAPHHADGVWIVELSRLEGGSAAVTNVVTAVALAIGAPAEGIDAEGLATYIGDRHLLVVLDNCEHLVDAVAATADVVLRQTPNTRMLATSREPLIVAGEIVWQVPPLDDDDAARLFVDRAALARPDVEFGDADRSTIGDLCRRLDAVPLAIELAAARVASMSIAQLASRVDDRFRLLTGGARTAEPRQRTLRAAIDWSHDLLGDDERTLLRRLSVFAGPWSLEAAEAVAGAGDPDAIERLGKLVRKSLVTAEPRDDGTYRYRMLETVREYAHERLVAAEETVEAGDRLLDWALARARDAQAEVNGPNQAAVLQSLDDDLPNLRAALEWAMTVRPNDGLELAGKLGQFFGVRGHLSEGRAWLERAIGLVEIESVEPMIAIGALTSAGTIARIQGDMATAIRHHEVQLGIARRLGVEIEIARAVNAIGTAHLAAGDLAAARPLLEESLEMRRRSGNRRAVALSLNNLGALANNEGDHERALAYYEEHLAVMREEGDLRVIGQCLYNIADIAIETGDLTRARALLDESLDLLIQVGDTRSISLTMSLVASLARLEGDTAQAMRLHAESLTMARDLGDPVIIRSNLEGVAALLVAQGDLDADGWARVARFLGAVSALLDARAERGAAMAAGTGTVEVAGRAAIGDAPFDQAVATGAATPTADVVEEVLRVLTG